MAVLRDAFHRNWKGLRELVEGGELCRYNLGWSLTRSLSNRFARQGDAAVRIVGEVTGEEGMREFREERDVMRIYDAIAHLEYGTYRDLIDKLGEYSD